MFLNSICFSLIGTKIDYLENICNIWRRLLSYGLSHKTVPFHPHKLGRGKQCDSYQGILHVPTLPLGFKITITSRETFLLWKEK